MSRERIFANPWWVVFGATLGLIVSNGPVMFFTFGVFLKPVAQHFGWNRTTAAFAITVSEVLNGISVPFAGKLVDRWGVRRVTCASIALFSATAMAISRTPANPAGFILLYAIFGVTGSGTSPVSYAKAISAWFEARRGLALGIAMSGVGLGTALMPQVARLLIDRVGWRGAYVGLALLVFGVAFPAVTLFVREPTARGTDSLTVEPSGVTLIEAVKGSSTFWLLGIAIFLVAAAVNGTIGHMVPMLTDRGISSQFATSMVTASGLALIAGRLLSGYLLDRFFGPYVAAGFFLMPFAGVIALSSGLGGSVPLLSATLLGLGLGAEMDLLAFFVGRYFGLRAFGLIYGCFMGIFFLGSGLGPWLMSLSFEKSHSYTLALAGFGLALLLASIAILCLGSYVYAPSKSR
jgi:MFS family permease